MQQDTNRNRRKALVGSVVVGTIIAAASGIAYFSNDDSGSGQATGDTIQIDLAAGDFTGRMLPVTLPASPVAADFEGRENSAVAGSYVIDNPNRTPLDLLLTDFSYAGETPELTALWEAETLYLLECESPVIDAACTVAEFDELAARTADTSLGQVAMTSTHDRNLWVFLADNGANQDEVAGQTVSFDLTVEGRTVGDIDNNNTGPFPG